MNLTINDLLAQIGRLHLENIALQGQVSALQKVIVAKNEDITRLKGEAAETPAAASEEPK